MLGNVDDVGGGLYRPPPTYFSRFSTECSDVYAVQCVQQLFVFIFCILSSRNCAG